MEFTSVPGVGEKTAAALADLDGAEAALRDGDVARLARAEGLSEGRAAAIARGAIRRRHDDPGGWAATDRAQELAADALGLLQERTVTDYAAKRLETLYPSPTRSRIEEVREWAARAVERDPDEAVLAALGGVEPLTEPRGLRVRERAVATADAERYAEAEAAFPELSVEVVEDRRGLAELARSYSTVVALDEAFAGVDVDGDVRVLPDAEEHPEEVVPERLLAFFATNRDRLHAAADTHEAAGLDPACDLDVLRDALARVTDDGGVVGDGELDRLSTAVDDLDAAASTAASVANDRLRDAIGERNVTIEGRDFLSLVEQGARVDSLLSRELSDEYDEAIGDARTHMADALDLAEGEAEFTERVFAGEPTFPVEYNDEPLSRLRTELKAARDRRAAKLKSDLAADLGALRGDVDELVREALELDVELAVARFADDFDCVVPEFVESEAATTASERADAPAAAEPGVATESDGRGRGGFRIEGGRSPLLDVPFEEVDPVDYEVSGVTLLSGVNSGGKTSTLDLVGLVVTLAHMGLPVPAESLRLRRVSELHYYAKSQGTLDAGAFESTLRDFGDLVDGAAGRLVLVDELESITEPGASAKIIAGILEALDDQGATAVFVSHLARQIREAAAFDVAVDGIEAVGLEDGELVVNRSPRKGHLARSTPELIVEKLAREARDGEDRADPACSGDSAGASDPGAGEAGESPGRAGFYDRLLGKF
ncbi:DNA mismatch repair protein, muts family [Candidatus Halobonum tyrrellensis]|uniref:DNA-binding protein MutS2 n=1 Tax=Candidatus Halobonum tyrrellensis G22 TaxID=1324957 RepID=V4HHX2_9EURY|nr:DNA mismatch repair protein, muts family [Candidatus Halobonum tyrrellensis G22]